MMLSKVFIFCIIATLVIGCNTSLKSKYSGTGQGVLVFEKEMHNFGQVNYGDILGVSFKCYNQGCESVIINKVILGCGCTEVNYSKEPLEPGDSLYLEVVFDSKGLQGRQVKKVTIQASDSLRTHNLYIWADVMN
ncbi:MAG: DUF1573 domain-containing protein [Marinilabiliaceae bacterium]|nr:DUF1573 domain-containing protein [Marinilabiliaceae bacterium]